MPAPGSGGKLQAGPWSTAGSWSTGSKPAGTSNNDVIVPGETNADITMASDEGGVDLDILTINPNYARLFGTSVAPIKISAKRIQVFGSAGFYFEGDDDAVSALPIDDVLIDCRNPGTPVELGTAAGSHADQDYQDFIRIMQGTVTFKQNMDLNATCDVILDGSGATLIIASEMPNAVVDLFVNRGTVISDGAITNLHIGNGGIVTQGTAVVATTRIYEGGTFILNHTAATTIEVWRGGTLDLSQVGDFKDITTLIIHKGAIIIGTFQEGLFGANPVQVTNLEDHRSDP